MKQGSKSKKVGLIHQNVQSLGNSIDMIEDMLRQHNNCLFLCLSEHWKTDQQLASLGIRGYHLVAKFCRSEGRHGGVAIYLRDDMKCQVRKKTGNLSIINEIEVVAIECSVGKCQMIIVTMYRPCDGNVQLFFQQLEQVLIDIFEETKIIFLVGDFNIDMCGTSKERDEFSSILNSFNLSQTIFEDTRITAYTSSCLDNIFTNCQQDYETFVLNTCIGDHTAQKIEFCIDMEKEDPVFRRSYTCINKTAFILELQKQTWDRVYEVDAADVDRQWSVFLNDFINIFNECFPVRYINKTRTRRKECVSEHVLGSKRQLDLMLIVSQHNNEYKEAYKAMKKEYDKLLRSERRKMYENRIAQSENKSKCVWRICREVTGRTQVSRECQLEGDNDVANEYNQFLLEVVPRMLNNISNNQFECNIRENDKSMFLTPVTPAEIIKITGELKNKHSHGCDDIPTSIIKSCVTEINIVLSYILNNSFTYGIFPEQLKLAHVIPVYKKGDPKMMQSYRPISLLPGFSKIFEKAMCTRLINFMISHQLFYINQHGYMKGKSTHTAIYQYLEHILHHLENNNLALGIFLDLSKAYDCIDHGCLLAKMKKYGVRGIALDWFKSYLMNRRQRVVIRRNNEKIISETLESRLGVPQGSVAGPILFVIYINDLYYSVTGANCNITSYADDTSLLVGASTCLELVALGSKLFADTANWLNDNKLILNKDKTKVVLFHTKQKKLDVPDSLTVSDSNIDLEVVKLTKFLGLQIEESLDWSEHIRKVCSALNSVCYSIRVISKYVSRDILKMIYHANFESLLRYGIIFWGGNSMIQQVFVIQKKVVRIMNNMKYDDSCRGTFKTNAIMTVYGMYVYECLMFIFRNKDEFLKNNHNHQYNTRTIDINYPVHRLTLTEKAPHYMCIKLYNKLPDSIKTVTDYKRFRNSVKAFIIDLEPYTLEDYLCCSSEQPG